MAVILCAAPLWAQDKEDITQPQSKPLPKPDWVKMIDHGKKDPRLKGYSTPEGIKVEIVAEAPTVINPVGMTFADDGTPFVLEWPVDPKGNGSRVVEKFTYKDGSTRDIATMKKSVKDLVKTLQWNSDKKVYDKATVVLEDELPSSILLHDGWLYLSGRGTVRRYKQSKPGGAYDVKEVIAQGFCGYHHHQVSGMTIGNDGYLYLTSGDNDNYVEGSDGSRATVLRTGAVFRCRPDGSKMQTFAIGFRNPYRDVAFDANFNMFHVDNDNEDGSKFTGCRLMHIAEGSDFGWRLRTGAECCVPDALRGAVFGELPGKMPSLLKTGRGAPAGLHIYNDTYLPEKYRGLLLYPDVLRRSIRAYRVEARFASFVATEEFELMKSDDPLFRPCQALVGPDGAIYVVDWRTDSGGAGRLSGDGKNGRIYRLSWEGAGDIEAIALRGMDSWAKIRKQSDKELIETLNSENFSDRQRARQELVKRGDKQRAELIKVLENTELSSGARIATVGALTTMWNDDVEKLFLKLLGTDSDDDVRRLIIDGLGWNTKKGDKDVHAALLKTLNADDLAIRRAAYLAMARIGAEGVADNLVNTLAFITRKESDPMHVDGLVRAIEMCDKEGVERLVALAESGVDTEIDRVVEAFAGMRIAAAPPAIPKLLENPHLTLEHRVKLIRSYNNYLLDPPIKLDPVLDYIVKNKTEGVAIHLAALEVLSLNNALKGDKAEKWLLELVETSDTNLRVPVVKAIENGKIAKAGPVLVKLLKEEKRPSAERIAILRALGVIKEASAVPVLKEVLAGEVSAERREALRALANVSPKDAAPLLDELVVGKDTAVQAEAVTLLSLDAAGAKKLGTLFLDKKLPRELLPQISDALRKHAAKDKEIEELLQKVMKLGLTIPNTKEEIDKVRKLVATKGNAQRGRDLYLKSEQLACVKCHRMEGVGGQIGPDLTRVWDTHSVEKLIESMVEPSKEIKEGFQTYVLSTKKGQIYAGLKISQSKEEVVLRDNAGHDIKVAVKDIDELTAGKESLMPDNVLGLLSYDQFIDLVAFLKSREMQESIRTKPKPEGKP